MKIIIDADACTKVIKEIAHRAAEKSQINLTVVANTHIRTPQSPLFKADGYRQFNICTNI
jgi:uncharacterized protein YaiI (UPF0178 family)